MVSVTIVERFQTVREFVREYRALLVVAVALAGIVAAVVLTFTGAGLHQLAALVACECCALVGVMALGRSR
jgi:hypothetical protein